MLRKAWFLTAGLLAATPVLAAPNTAAFRRKCEASVPVASCGCMANELQQSRTGQITLDAFRVLEFPKDQQQAAALELANKYGSKLSEIKAATDRAEATMREAYETCK